MFFKQVAVGSLLCGVLSAIAGLAQADNINTSGVSCQNYNAGEALDIDRLTSGVRNIASSSRSVICSFPRSPANDGASLPFIVDGNNNGSTTTPCTVTVYTQNGTIEGTKTFTGSGTDWRRTVTFDAGTILSGGYATVLCTLPGSTNGQIFGLASVQ
jgi:hypothetical protein